MTLAVDIGGSGVRAARLDKDGTMGPVHALPLDLQISRDELRDKVERVVGDLDPRPDSDGAVGVAVPAFIDADGRVRFSVNLPAMEGVTPSDLLMRVAPGLPVVAIADVAAAAVGEARFGVGKGVERFLCVSLGTGANAAMVVDGRLLATAFDCLGDAGHVVVEPDGPDCVCGGRGCLEAVASGVALVREGSALGFVTAHEMVAAALDGNREVQAVVARAGRALGRALAIWAALLWPERVAVSGGLSTLGDLLLDPARREMARVGASYIVDRIEVVGAALGTAATLVGAALWSYERTTEEV